MVFVYILIGLVVGLGVGILLSHTSLKNKLEKEGRTLLKEAEEKAEIIKKEKMLQAKEKFLQLKGEHEKQVQERNNKVMQAENKIKQKEQTLNQKVEELQKKSNEFLQAKESLNKQVEKLQQRQQEVEKTYKESVAKLEQIAGLSAEEAKAQLVETLTEEAKDEAMSKIMDIVEEAKLTANQQAKKIVIESIQRTATENAIENTVSVFNLESEEVKGRIIGREGRNIRTLENLTGVEVIIDDSPDAILLSCFDPVRREIARLSLHKLVTDGRIHPARIEEVVAKTKKQIEQEVIETGKRTCIDLGIVNLHPELIRIVGKMKYRSSYGQNLLQHSREVANLCATMASELGLNPKIAKRAGLLHDIGKLIELSTDEMGITVAIGADGKISNVLLTGYYESKDFGADYPATYIGQDSALGGVDTVAGTTFSSTAFKDAITDAFTVLIENNLVAAGQKSEEQLIAEAMPLALPGCVNSLGNPVTVPVEGVAAPITQAFKAKNNCGYIYVVSTDAGSVVVGVNAFGVAKAIDLEGNDVTATATDAVAAAVAAKRTK